MNQERDRILDLLAAGKITTEEASRLLDAVEARAAGPPPAAAPHNGSGGQPKLK
jgi:hypothetical protein